MTAAAAHPATSRVAIDEAVAAVAERRTAFARTPVAEKITWLRELQARVLDVAPAWVTAGCQAKRIPVGTPLEGEEWLAGPMTTIRNARLLADTLARIAKSGRPAFGRGSRTRADGRVEVDVFPAGGWDGTLYRGIACHALMAAGLDEATLRQRQASFYEETSPEGKVSLVLGAGNVSSIPAMDVLAKMFIEGHVCILKMNPVNEWVGPFLERAFEPLISRNFLRVVYGAGDVGAYLCQHPGVDDIHITGSDKTHDVIVWGPPGSEQERRKRAHDPVLKKPITSELGNVSPVAVVPGRYTEKELAFQARNVVTMVVNNGSFNCNAAKVLITAPGWPQRDRFLTLVREGLSRVPPRYAYYPGAADRHRALTSGHPHLVSIGEARDGALPWTLITGIDARRADEPLFRIEPFCSILSHTEVGDADPASFLTAITEFCNERLWGTLNAALIIDPRTEGDPAVAQALDRAIVDLRYGTVAINIWPAVGYGSVSPPWGGHPSATLANVQSGIGWVHNTFMLEGIEKSVLRGDITLSPKPAWFFDNTMTNVIGERLTRFEAAPSAWQVAGLAMASLRG